MLAHRVASVDRLTCATCAQEKLNTIWRVLKRRGFGHAQPQKRPKSSRVRFQASLPNECWQSDVIHFRLADGSEFEIISFIEDHSRLLCRLRSGRGDKGARCSARLQRRHACLPGPGRPAHRQRVRPHGLAPGWQGRPRDRARAPRGYRQALSAESAPQTCGKVERFRQTLKKYLAKQDISSLVEQQQPIDRFAAYYNARRPHRCIGLRTPKEVYDENVKAHPAGGPVAHYRVCHDIVDRDGR